MTSKKPPALMRPWLVGWSDIRRYLGRALDAVERGHVVLIICPKHMRTHPDRPRLIAIAPAANWWPAAGAAFEDYAHGRFRRVRLPDLPRRPREARS